ncbi:hypothetical protein [Streptomyces anatolicus]|nr:hypothetical protein [Streptomyces anatolicus]
MAARAFAVPLQTALRQRPAKERGFAPCDARALVQGDAVPRLAYVSAFPL